MTILQVCAYAALYEGNFVKSLRALEKKLQHLGHEMIYAFPESAKDIDWCKALSEISTVYFLPLAKARIKPKTYRMMSNIYKAHPDLKIIHTHFELYDVPVSLTAPRNVKVFWHLHDALEIYNSPKHRLVHRLQYGLLHKRALLLSVSQKHMKYVIRCGFPQEQTVYLPNGLDLDRIEFVKKPVEEREYDFTIFGWEYERKGVDLAIKAGKMLNGEITLAVVGDSQTEETINKEFGRQQFVNVIEPVKDINSLYSKTKCFLHISRAEGLSYALLEAVYAGLPVICSDIPENQFADVFPTVTMVKNENIESIARAMQERLNHKTANSDSVRQSRRIIEAKYSIESWVNSILIQYGIA